MNNNTNPPPLLEPPLFGILLANILGIWPRAWYRYNKYINMRNKQQASNKDNKLTTCCVLCVYLCLRCKIEVSISLYKKSKCNTHNQYLSYICYCYRPILPPINQASLVRKRKGIECLCCCRDMELQCHLYSNCPQPSLPSRTVRGHY